jgi:hypothetical protein
LALFEEAVSMIEELDVEVLNTEAAADQGLDIK